VFAWVGLAHAPSPDVRFGLSPPLTPRWLRFAILAALASEAGSRGTGKPSRHSFLFTPFFRAASARRTVA